MRLVPKPEIPPAERVRNRLRAMREDGVLQCPRCAGRSALTEISGQRRVKGKLQGGTVLHKNVCAVCYRKGDIVPMDPDIRPV